MFRDQLLVEDILSFAIEKLEGDNYDETVCELASEYEDNIDKIDYLIKKLATDEDSDFNLELRKWRAIFIAKEIEDKSDNLIDGLMHLGEIWVKLGFPEDSPHIFQGRNNNITPEEYYTQENYDYLYEKHIEWLQKEIKSIKCNQS